MVAKARRFRRWDCVVSRVPSGAIGAEVGIYLGKMSQALFDRIPNLILYMVDRWKPYSDEERNASPNTLAYLEQEKWDKIKEEAFKVASLNKGAIVIEKDSIEAANLLKDFSLDFAFLDGDHSYEGVKKDILAWKSKIKNGGWLIGHDYDNKPDGGVKRAVDEFFGTKVEIDSDHVWAVRL